MIERDPVQSGDDLRGRLEATAALEHPHCDQRDVGRDADGRDISIRGDDSGDVRSVPVVVARTSRAVLLRRSARAAVGYDEAMFGDEGTRQVRVGLVDTAVEHGDRHALARETLRMGDVAANQRQAFGICRVAAAV